MLRISRWLWHENVLIFTLIWYSEWCHYACSGHWHNFFSCRLGRWCGPGLSLSFLDVYARKFVQGTLTEGGGSVQLTSLYTNWFRYDPFNIANIIYCLTKQFTLMRRSTVLSPPVQLVFPGLLTNGFSPPFTFFYRRGFDASSFRRRVISSSATLSIICLNQGTLSEGEEIIVCTERAWVRSSTSMTLLHNGFSWLTKILFAFH